MHHRSKAVAFKKTSTRNFKRYAPAVVENAAALAQD